MRHKGFQAGMVISASHNPFHDNGVKLFSGAGMKFSDSVEEIMEQDIFAHRGQGAPIDAAHLVADASLDAEYLAFLRTRVIPGAKLAGFRIMLDCANGAAYKLGPELFQSLGANVTAIGVTFPIGGISMRVAVRCIWKACATALWRSRPLWESRSTAMPTARFSCALVGTNCERRWSAAFGCAVPQDPGETQGQLREWPLPCRIWGWRRVLARDGIAMTRAAVGDRYTFLRRCCAAATFWGASSPGTSFFLDDSPAGDGLLTAVKVASLVSMRGQLTPLIEGLKDYPQVIVNVKVSSKPPLESLPAVSRALAEAQSALGDNGRIVLRYSGTEPLARVMVEAEEAGDVQRFSQALAEAVRSSIGA